MKRSKLLLNKNLLEKYEQQQNVSTRVAMINNICEKIINSEYDDLIISDSEKIFVNGYKDKLDEARKKANEMGYKSLTVLFEEIMKSEMKHR
ncbi:hypothetical protein ACOP1M_12570 [Staphylococcus warneri]|uniref:hypothetical protein n=1 Tax=Staphylococcus warneri TaxID=1292 RepID=UPI003CF8E184